MYFPRDSWYDLIMVKASNTKVKVTTVSIDVSFARMTRAERHLRTVAAMQTVTRAVNRWIYSR